MPECFFAHLGGCEGRLVKAHLVPKSRLKIEMRTRTDLGHDGLDEAIWDPRCWRWMCVGHGYGNVGHHGMSDAYQLPRECPDDLFEYLRDHDLEWMATAYLNRVESEASET